MILISSRKDFWSCTEISDVDEIRACVLTDPDPSVDQPQDPEAFLSTLRGKRLLLLVHGYNNDEDVARAYDVIEKKVAALMPGTYDQVLGYTWPGGNLGISYPSAKARGKSCGPRLTLWLERILVEAATVDLMCHSLGNYVALRALQNLVPPDGRLRIACMTAAAVDNESIQFGEPYYQASALFTSFCVLHSKHDGVLQLAYPAGEFVSSGLPDVALGYSGPEDPAVILAHSPNVKVANCGKVVFKHGGYKGCDAMYRYLNQEIQGQGASQFSTL